MTFGVIGPRSPRSRRTSPWPAIVFKVGDSFDFGLPVIRVYRLSKIAQEGRRNPVFIFTALGLLEYSNTLFGSHRKIADDIRFILRSLPYRIFEKRCPASSTLARLLNALRRK